MTKVVRRLAAAMLFVAAGSAQAQLKLPLAKCPAQYSGSLVFEALPDGQRVRLAKPYAFTDKDCQIWQVPEKAIVDGASIPRALFSVVGGALDGQYRNASVLHDWYCITRNRPWQQVHRMFYEAMLASGVNKIKAKIMYLAVYYGGPRWNDMIVSNATMIYGISLPSRPAKSPAESSTGPVDETVAANDKPVAAPLESAFQSDEAVFKNMAAIVEKQDLAPEAIEALAEVVRPSRSLPRLQWAREMGNFNQAMVAYRVALENQQALSAAYQATAMINASPAGMEGPR